MDDYDVVVTGVAKMLDPYRDRVVVAELDTNKPLEDEVDIALYDSFAQPESDHDEIKTLINNPRARRVVVYTWNFHHELLSMARDLGVHGYLSKALTARELVAALESVHAGEIVVSAPATKTRNTIGDWPGRGEGLTDREAEVLALITQGRSNAEIAALTYLSPQHGQDLHPHPLSQDRGRQSEPGRPLGSAQRVHARSPPHRALAGRPLTRPLMPVRLLGRALHVSHPLAYGLRRVPSEPPRACDRPPGACHRPRHQ